MSWSRLRSSYCIRKPAAVHIGADSGGPDPTKIWLWGLLWLRPHEHFNEINLNAYRERLCKPIERSKSPDHRDFAPDPTRGAYSAPQTPSWWKGEHATQKYPPLSARQASLFGPSGLAISVDPTVL